METEKEIRNMMINEMRLQGVVVKQPEPIMVDGVSKGLKFTMKWEGPVGKSGKAPSVTLFVSAWGKKAELIEKLRLQLGDRVDAKGPLRADMTKNKKTGEDMWWWKIDAEEVGKMSAEIPQTDDLPF